MPLITRRFTLTSLSVAALAITACIARGEPKALAISAPAPVKLAEASRLRLAGSGVFVMRLDIDSGKVTAVDVQKSTGQKLLDTSALQGLQRWLWKPHILRRVTVPITFTATDDVARF